MSVIFWFCLCLLEMFCVGSNYHTYVICACVYVGLHFSFSDCKSNFLFRGNLESTKVQKSE